MLGHRPIPIRVDPYGLAHSCLSQMRSSGLTPQGNFDANLPPFPTTQGLDIIPETGSNAEMHDCQAQEIVGVSVFLAVRTSVRCSEVGASIRSVEWEGPLYPQWMMHAVVTRGIEGPPFEDGDFWRADPITAACLLAQQRGFGYLRGFFPNGTSVNVYWDDHHKMIVFNRFGNPTDHVVWLPGRNLQQNGCPVFI